MGEVAGRVGFAVGEVAGRVGFAVGEGRGEGRVDWVREAAARSGRVGGRRVGSR